VDSGQWSVVSGQWSVVSGQWSGVRGQGSGVSTHNAALAKPVAPIVYPSFFIPHLLSLILYPSSVAGTADCDHWDIEAVADAGDGLAVNDIHDAAVSVPAHHDQIYALFLGDAHKFSGGIAVA
jgi:hypothetical protein